MFGFLLRWSINLLALVTAGIFIDGIVIQSIGMGIVAAGILGVVNAVIRPVVLLLTLPINLLIINALMLQLVAWLVPGFVVETFTAALLGALLISLTSWLLNLFVSGDGKVVYIKKVEGRKKDEE
jgi:putative membrane protein